jgi:hypothetical protein
LLRALAPAALSSGATAVLDPGGRRLAVLATATPDADPYWLSL